MQGLLATIEVMKLSKSDIDLLVRVLDAKRVVLEDGDLSRKRDKLLNQRVPEEWLEAAANRFDHLLKGYDHPDEEDVEDAMIDAFYSASDGIEMDLYVRIKHGTVTCKRSDCWYTNNRDRVGEYEYSYHHIFKNDKFYCDMCFNDHGKSTIDREISDHFYPQFEKYMRGLGSKRVKKGL